MSINILSGGTETAIATRVAITTSVLTEKSLIFATPRDDPVAVSTTKTGKSEFEIRIIKEALSQNLEIN